MIKILINKSLENHIDLINVLKSSFEVHFRHIQTSLIVQGHHFIIVNDNDLLFTKSRNKIINQINCLKKNLNAYKYYI